MFLAEGFEGASMNDIAKAAGVSKGTLYVYFENKERLFAAIVAEERYAHVNEIFSIDNDDRDVEGVAALRNGEGHRCHALDDVEPDAAVVAHVECLSSYCPAVSSAPPAAAGSSGRIRMSHPCP